MFYIIIDSTRWARTKKKSSGMSKSIHVLFLVWQRTLGAVEATAAAMEDIRQTEPTVSTVTDSVQVLW